MSNETKTKGMGAILHHGGVAFRVWAPHAQKVSVIGSFNEWDSVKHPMHSEDQGDWYLDIAEAKTGYEYLFFLSTENGEF